jgi:hypothetical protein
MPIMAYNPLSPDDRNSNLNTLQLFRGWTRARTARECVDCIEYSPMPSCDSCPMTEGYLPDFGLQSPNSRSHVGRLMKRHRMSLTIWLCNIRGPVWSREGSCKDKNCLPEAIVRTLTGDTASVVFDARCAAVGVQARTSTHLPAELAQRTRRLRAVRSARFDPHCCDRSRHALLRSSASPSAWSRWPSAMSHVIRAVAPRARCRALRAVSQSDLELTLAVQPLDAPEAPRRSTFDPCVRAALARPRSPLRAS